MKKKNALSANLKLVKTNIVILTSGEMEKIAAGDDSIIKPQPGSFDCIPPYNAAPYLTQKYCN